MKQRFPAVVRRGLFLFILLLVGCAPSTPQLVRSSWSDQLAAIDRVLPNLSGDYVLVEGLARPKRESLEPYGADEPVDLRVYLAFQNQKSSRVDADGAPLYATRIVTFYDHRLATTLAVSDEEFATRSSDSPVIPARSIRLGAQDALQLVLADGQDYMGKPVNIGNLDIHLRRAGDNSVESRGHAVWELTFHKGKDHTLTISVDAQSGAIIKRTEE